MTTRACPTALQTPHPSAKQVGKAISPPPCEAGVPIYPLRYGIADAPYRSDLHTMLKTPGYPVLQGGKAYGLRVLRPGTYVYLLYFDHGQMWNRHYQVTEDIRFAPIWWGDADYEHSTPGSQSRPDVTGAAPYLLAPPAAINGPVYLLISDTVLTHDTLWQIEKNTDGLRDALATVVTPTGGPDQPHVFHAARLTVSTPELIRPTLSRVPMYYAWSEITPAQHYPDVSDVISQMYAALRARKDVVPLAVALQDPVGIASELNYLCATEVKKRDGYQAQSKHRLNSAGLIDAYFKQAEANSTTPPALTALARQRALVNLPGARDFIPAYQARVEAFQTDITRACADVVAWLQRVNAAGLLGQAFSLFDQRCAQNARSFETTVLHCFGAAVHSDEGLAELAKHIEAAPDISPLWRALGAGDKPLMMRLAEPLTIGKGVFDAVDRILEERPGTLVTNLLTQLLWPFLAKAHADIAEVQVRRLRHIGEIRFGVTVGRRLVTPQRYLAYSAELQGYVAMGKEVAVRWPGAFMPATIKGAAASVEVGNIEVWEWETVTTTTVVDKAKAMDQEGNPLMRNLKRMRAAAGAASTGLGGALAIWGMRNAVQEWDKNKSAISFTSILGAGAALMGATLDAVALGISTAAARRGSVNLGTKANLAGIKLLSTAAATTAASIFSLTDLIRAADAQSNDKNPEQAQMYLYSALAGGVLAVATGAGGMASAATLAGSGKAVAVLGLTPAGWAVIAILAMSAVIYFTLQADDAQHSPLEIWLKHTAWGVITPRFTLAQELDAWHSLHFSPLITPEWQALRGIAGTLRLRCTLPEVAGQDDFQSKLHVTLYGKDLERVDDTIASCTPDARVDLNTQYVIGPLTDDKGAECGWRIGMHEDAKVKLEYLYRPDPKELPTIGLEQPGAPEPLVFTSSSFFFDSIDPAKLAPVRAPK
ncbi:toxin VasX [Achromobacter kerstersii]|uniref:toxin VasX n=1 Tax=Achromobacter kerstersii TaxID=1353890 RepID=UPI00320A0EE2